MRILEPKNVLPILHTKHVFLALEPPKIFFFSKKTLQASYTHLLRWFRTIFNMGYGGGPNRPPLAPQRSKNSLHPEGLNNKDEKEKYLIATTTAVVENGGRLRSLANRIFICPSVYVILYISAKGKYLWTFMSKKWKIHSNVCKKQRKKSILFTIKYDLLFLPF